ncbi:MULTISPECIES: SAM-dependent methyltransferase [unclassified Iodidimonas]|uniref:class I SAM-dependent methyltransferase n=1 Tax=unclassified Iodidimonas TaxID=2626145 RepID=UPI00248291A4|nr:MULTISPECIES: SAM-dependent methyltransferase [unclassified Iodidimonas]
MSTPLARLLHERIASDGPMTVHRYMSEALMHPDHGYYRKNDPLGGAGDFITAPEISQIFGELIGLWLADRWEAMGQPRRVRLVELGPGRGTLMADALRALSVVPGLKEAVTVHFVEANEALIKAQAQRLGRMGIAKPQWHDHFDDVPDGPVLLIANEFFDALPVHQLVKTENGWAERAITSDGQTFSFCLYPADQDQIDLVDLVPEALRSAPIGSIVEICPAGLAVCEDISRRILAFDGAALIIDYGHCVSGVGETLQAVRRHQRVDIFHRPGQTDLTAHVDFQQLAITARHHGAAVAGPITQGDFLKALGIDVRAALLCSRAGDKQQKEIKAAVRRLTAPDLMGDLFKVMAIVPLRRLLPGFRRAAHSDTE